MKMLQTLVRFLFSKTMVLLLLIVGFGLLVWFGGPFVGFGESRPLESAANRMVVLLFTLSLMLFWLLHWPVSIVGVTALCLLIWYGSPLLFIAETQPFGEEWVRLLLIGLLGGCFLVYLLYRLWQAVRANDDLLQKLLHPSFGKVESPAHKQIQELQTIVQRAMGHLRTLTTGVSGLARVLHGSRYIYELPWYMILGAPGTGKTTAILNSGLTFPLAEQLGAASLSGVSGTRNCEWWFSNEAVLIDTAGRYTTHESNLEVDAAEWKGFLNLLRKHRPRAPINGALLAVSVEDLTNASRAERIQLAAQLRERLLQLQEALGIRFPVYVVITKMDLLKGFQEYFYGLNQHGRNQVWGFTVPATGKETSHRPAMTELGELYAGELTLLYKRLEQGLDARLREEYVIGRRRDMYCFPTEFAGLFDPLLELVELVFLESRYAGSQVQPMLRGMYFTSAAQGGQPTSGHANTLLQRLQGLVKSGQEWMQDKEKAGRPPNSTPTGTCSYFLHDMLQRVIFPEAFLVKPNTRWEWRFLLARSLGHVVVVVAGLTVALALYTSKQNNEELIHDVAGRVEQVEGTLGMVSREGRDDMIAFALHQVCGLTEYDEFDVDSPPLEYRMGLYSLQNVTQQSRRACTILQERFLMPKAIERLETRLKAAVAANGKAQRSEVQAEAGTDLYAMLRVYLSFYDHNRYDPAAMFLWFVEDMKANPERHFLTIHESLAGHLEKSLHEKSVQEKKRHQGTGSSATFDSTASLTSATLTNALSTNALSTNAPSTTALHSTASLNTLLVAKARELLQRESREERLYSRVKSRLEVEAPEGFIPARHLDEQGLRMVYRASGRSMTEALPGLFTYEGYHGLFERKVPLVMPDIVQEDAWIMGDEGSSSRAKDGVFAVQRTSLQMRKLYLKEYAAIWKGFLEDVRVVLGTVPESNVALLRILGGSASPLEQLAKGVVLETALSAKEKDLTGQLTELAEKKLKSKTKTTGLTFNPLDEVNLVDNQFAALRKVITGSGAPAAARAPAVPDSAELSIIRGLCSEYAMYLQEVAKAVSSKTLPPLNDITERLIAKAGQLPPFFSTALQDIARSGAAQEGETREQTLAQLVESQVGGPCRKQLGNRYPFNPKGRDVRSEALVSLLGSGGIFDAFFQKNLAPLVNTDASPWVYLTEMPNGPDLQPFEQAAALREVLFATPEAKQWNMELTMSVLEMDARIERLDMRIGEATLVYEHGPSAPVAINWQGESPKSMVSLHVRPRNLGLAPIQETGPWALLRFVRHGQMEPAEVPGKFNLEFDLEGYTVLLEVIAPEANVLTTDLVESFQCPKAIP